MILTERQKEAICTAARDAFGSAARAWMFGPCIDDHGRISDTNLFVSPSATENAPALARKIQFLAALECILNDRIVAVYIESLDDPHPIAGFARETGLEL